jgi:hypothetical protein
MSAPEIVLTHEDGMWRARGEGIDVAHGDLRELDALVAAQLAGRSAIDVHVKFDTAALPRHLHQYHAHYSNYTLRVPGRDSS